MNQVAAAVIIDNGRLFLARRAAGQTLAGYWELPGGKVEDGESLEACLKRELCEELEMQASVGAVLASTTYQYEHGCFEMIALSAHPQSSYRLTVHDQAIWVNRDELTGVLLAPADVELTAQLVASGHL